MAAGAVYQMVDRRGEVTIPLLTQNGDPVQRLSGRDQELLGFFLKYLTTYDLQTPGWFTGQDVNAIRANISTFASGRMVALNDLPSPCRGTHEYWGDLVPNEVTCFKVAGVAANTILQNIAKHTRFLNAGVDEATSQSRVRRLLFFMGNRNFITELEENRSLSDHAEVFPDDAGLTLCRYAASGDELLTEICLKRLPASLHPGYLKLAEECATINNHHAVIRLLNSDLHSLCSKTRRERQWRHLLRNEWCPKLLAVALIVSISFNIFHSPASSDRNCS